MRRVPCAPAVPLALLLVTLTAAPSGAVVTETVVTEATGGSVTGAEAVEAVGLRSSVEQAEAVRGAAARAVRAHEAARARVARLRAADARPTKIESAERRRKEIRAGLWDLLWAKGRATGDPVAVDPTGRAGDCPRKGHGDKGKGKGKGKQKEEGRGRARGGSPSGAGAAPAEDTWSPGPTASRDLAAVSGSPGSTAPGTPRPWTAPTRDYWLSAGFAATGDRWAHRHTGQDFAVSTGTPVYAVGPGTVRATTCGDGFGNQVVVRHADGYFTQYAHLSRVDVRAGERVTAGERLGLAGATGNVTGPHLHFEVRITPYLGSSVPPLPWLRDKEVRVGP